MDFYLGYWEGAIHNQWHHWLRFYDLKGNLVLLTDEKERQEKLQAQKETALAQKETTRAKQEAAQKEHKTKLRTAINMIKMDANIDFIASVVELDKEYLERLLKKF